MSCSMGLPFRVLLPHRNAPSSPRARLGSGVLFQRLTFLICKCPTRPCLVYLSISLPLRFVVFLYAGIHSLSLPHHTKWPIPRALRSGNAPQTWREALGNHIYLGTKSPAWTDQDRRIFLVYAARYKWTQALQPNDAGSKNLQKELLMYTAHRGLNDAIMVDMVHAIRYFLLSLSLSLPHHGPSLIQTSPSDRATLEQVRRGFENLYQWPDWTKRWFLNPWWDGETNEPRANGPGPRLDLFPHNASDEGRQTIDVLAHWDHMTDEEKDMCFEAARAAAQEGQNPTMALLGRYPVRRMVFALPGLN
ncbi:hypothetical protein IWZ03DRAFT_90731 [Phyllosticta citriasiana]|uniref:Uncharacterized protein n=1 Tax=Phyllosticta citriasiana TaxID=595635 RepID=A0ABR1KB22_9PEZI